MNNFIKKVSVIVVCCAVLSMASVSAYAASVAYDTTATKNLVSLANDTKSAKTISANTRPINGTSGVVVNVIASNGTVKASRLFPYQVSISDLEASFPSSSVRRIQVEPHRSGERIVGSVSYSVK